MEQIFRHHWHNHGRECQPPRRTSVCASAKTSPNEQQGWNWLSSKSRQVERTLALNAGKQGTGRRKAKGRISKTPNKKTHEWPDYTFSQQHFRVLKLYCLPVSHIITASAALFEFELKTIKCYYRLSSRAVVVTSKPDTPTLPPKSLSPAGSLAGNDECSTVSSRIPSLFLRLYIELAGRLWEEGCGCTLIVPHRLLHLNI